MVSRTAVFFCYVQNTFFFHGSLFFIHYLHCQFPVTFMRCCGSCGLIVHRSIHPSLPLEAIYLIEITQRIGRSTDGEIAVSRYKILYKRTKIILNCNDILMSARMAISISVTMWYIFGKFRRAKSRTIANESFNLPQIPPSFLSTDL
jgi:hypothetical protein